MTYMYVTRMSPSEPCVRIMCNMVVNLTSDCSGSVVMYCFFSHCTTPYGESLANTVKVASLLVPIIANHGQIYLTPKFIVLYDYY